MFDRGPKAIRPTSAYVLIRESAKINLARIFALHFSVKTPHLDFLDERTCNRMSEHKE